MAKPDTTSPPIKAAYRRGLSAGMRGLDNSHNPHLNDGQAVDDLRGWSRLYARTWHDGWVDGLAKRSEMGLSNRPRQLLSDYPPVEESERGTVG